MAPPHRGEGEILRVPIRKVIIPIKPDLVHAATVHRAGQAASMLHEVTSERGIGWPNFHVVDVAVQGLVQSIYELCHATNPPTQVLQNSLSRRCTVRLDTICASHCRCDQ